MSATSFFGGAFFGGEFFNAASAPVVAVEEATRPRPDDGGGRKTLSLKRRSIVKPSGLVDRPQSLDERVEQTAEIAREVAREVIGGSSGEPPPISGMSMADVDREIGVLLRKKMRTEEDELLLLLLVAASAAG